MGSSGKKRTTMAKLNREARLREKRAEKQTRKAARKLSASNDGVDGWSGSEEFGPASAGLDDDDGPGDAAPESTAAVSDAAVRNA